MVTIRTSIEPDRKVFTHWVVIANNLARSGDEVDRWRLFDLKNRRVTFVDEVTKTYRQETMPALLAAARRASSQPLPAGIPVVSVSRTTARKTIQGVPASQIVMRAGTYLRELWIATHPLIPPQLFPMMIASAPPDSKLSAMTRTATEVLLGSQGFPLADHSEIAYDDQKIVVDREVVRIEKRDVPQSWLTIAREYKDVTPRPVPPPRRGTARR